MGLKVSEQVAGDGAEVSLQALSKAPLRHKFVTLRKEQASEARRARDPAPARFFDPSNLLVQTLCHVLKGPGRDPKKTLKGSRAPRNIALAHLVPLLEIPDDRVSSSQGGA